MRRISRLLSIALVLYSLVCLGMYLAQDSLLYPGMSTAPALDPEPPATVLTVPSRGESFSLAHPFRPPQTPGTPTLIVFHGNADSARNTMRRFRPLADQGYGLLAMAYRGFEGRPGRPGEAALKQDARDALDALNRYGIADRDIIAYGHSLGTGIAVTLGAERDLRAVILEAPYRSIEELAVRSYPWLPVTLLLKDPWHNLPLMPRISEPLMVLHGEADRIIPVAHGRDILTAAAGEKVGIFPPHADHNNLFRHGGLEKVTTFLDALSP